ncbi:MAG: DUF2085 domain-containing protein [Anaerolineae bacterium]|nr:DUF2085 domain-containing protein [Anaerolineae bacterium]
MSQLSPTVSPHNFSRVLGFWANRLVGWLSGHWLAVLNTFFFLYVGLPFLAPLLLTANHARSANFIYWWYQFLCHLFPSRTYFIAGEQVCLCHRCIAIYGTISLGGIVFSFVRRSLKPLPPRWYLLFLLPMTLDGGMGLASELAQFVPMPLLSITTVVFITFVTILLYTQKQLTWPVIIFLACGVVAAGYLQFWGLHQSNLFLRNFTGVMFGLGTVWVAYPLLEEGFGEIQQETNARWTGQPGNGLYGKS